MYVPPKKECYYAQDDTLTTFPEIGAFLTYNEHSRFSRDGDIAHMGEYLDWRAMFSIVSYACCIFRVNCISYLKIDYMTGLS
jgi:hypothetical protein